MDNSLFSHPIAEEPHPGALTTPQADRYGSLFLQPFYTPAPATDGEHEPAPQRQARAAHDPSGRRPRR